MSEKLPEGSSEPPFESWVRFGGMGYLVQALLDKAGMNYRDAEKRLGGDHTAWFRWTKGERFIGDDMLGALAKAAGIDPEQVFAYGVLKAMEKHYPEIFTQHVVREELYDVLQLLEKSA